jgi:hypothetical protein
MHDSQADLSPTVLSSRSDSAGARSALLGLAIVATFTTDAALAAVPGQFPDWPAMALLGLALGQVVVAAAWLALGNSCWLARCATFPLVAISLAHMLAPKLKPTAAEMLGVFLAVGAVVAVLLLAARASGVRIVAGGVPDETPGRRLLASRSYSLASLFALTTVVAVFAAITRETSFPVEQRLAATLHCFGFVAAAILPLAMWSGGMRGGLWRWLLGAMVLGAAWGAAAGPIGRVAAVEAAFMWMAACLLLECDFHLFSPSSSSSS